MSVKWYVAILYMIRLHQANAVGIYCKIIHVISVAAAINKPIIVDNKKPEGY